MAVKLNLFPGGKRRALTMSYDDGAHQDRKLISIFNEYGIKGTFHLCSGWLHNDSRIQENEVSSLYKGHEIACHTKDHPMLTELPLECIASQITQDRRVLEELAGYPVVGLSYPFGCYNESCIEILRSCGIVYSRTVKRQERDFLSPSDFMYWAPTAHHNDDLNELYKKFIKECFVGLPVMYVWGHSYEFDRDNNWQKIIDFCELVSGDKDTWYATNIEIYQYITAQRKLKFSLDMTTVFNPSNISVFITKDDIPVELLPGKITKLK